MAESRRAAGREHVVSGPFRYVLTEAENVAAAHAPNRSKHDESQEWERKPKLRREDSRMMKLRSRRVVSQESVANQVERENAHEPDGHRGPAGQNCGERSEAHGMEAKELRVVQRVDDPRGTAGLGVLGRQARVRGLDDVGQSREAVEVNVLARDAVRSEYVDRGIDHLRRTAEIRVCAGLHETGKHVGH